MNIAELDRKAIEIATKSLQRGFDWQAYLVYKAAVKQSYANTERLDIVPESNADEGMAEAIALFTKYAACKRGNLPEKETLESLESVVTKIRRIIVEIYHLCGSEKERQIVKQIKNELP